MLRCKLCNDCKYYVKDFFVDMGINMDGCSFYEKKLHLEWHECMMCQDWKAERNGEIVLEACPFYEKKPSFTASSFPQAIAEIFSKSFQDLYDSLVVPVSDDTDYELTDDDEDI